MSIEAVQSPFANVGMSTASAPSGAKSESVFLGHTVTVNDSPESLIADAAEEIGFSVDKTQDHEIGRRKDKERAEAPSKKLLEMYRLMMQRPEKAQAESELVGALKRQKSAEAMAKSLQDAFADPTDAWAALEAAMETFDADPEVDASSRAALKTVYDDFMREKGEAARLGLRGALAAQGRADFSDIDEGKSLYRHAVGEFSSVREVFADIQKQYGTRFDAAMDFLFSALSADIDSEAPSMGKAHLESVHGKLSLVRLTQSAFLICGDVLDRWHNEHGVAASALTPTALLDDILKQIEQRWSGTSACNAVVQKAGAPDIEREVLFTQDVLAAVKRFPTELFDDADARERLIDSWQSTLDEAVAREDEYLASLEDE